MRIIKNLYARVGAVVTTSFWGTQQAIAQGGNQSLGDMGKNVGESGEGIGSMLWIGCLILGFVFVISGLTMAARAHKNRDGIGGPLAMIGIGSVMMAVPVVIGIMQTTAFGSSDTQGAFNEIGIG